VNKWEYENIGVGGCRGERGGGFNGLILALWREEKMVVHILAQYVHAERNTF
jgi:hypothetical protein